ncbi:UTP--glucose-1-phosphate uridylyltransferase [bacterium]|nr:UTP--glucose-1-phosphate uridylyltransferase [bacterium]
MLKLQDERDQILVAKAYEAGQEHVFDFWEELSREQRRSLLDQVEKIDFQQLQRLDRLRGDTSKLSRLPTAPSLDPPPVIELPTTPEDHARRAEAEKRGQEALEAGRVACFVAAGGQGTRLGWEHPKGTYGVGPVTGKSLFQLFSEQIAAIQRRAKHELLWIIMTSSSNDEETQAYFREHTFFGLAAPQVRFLVQKDMPVVDFRGKLLLEIRPGPHWHRFWEWYRHHKR